MLTSSKVLAHYNPKLSLRLATDASSYGVGVVLTQVSEEGTERPIAFVSRTLSDAEQNYAQTEDHLRDKKNSCVFVWVRVRVRVRVIFC